MKTIGVRQLRQRASEYLRRVEAGGTLEVTARGRAVALLVPARHAGRRERLVAQGRIAPGTGDLLALGPPLPPAFHVAPRASCSGRRVTASDNVVYLDSSALVKLVVVERESTALRRFLRKEPMRASCALARVEVIRAVRPHGTTALSRARQLLRRLDLIQLDDELLDTAAMLEGGVLRSLDAIHVAAARTLRR